jgi:hypothetical protein
MNKMGASFTFKETPELTEIEKRWYGTIVSDINYHIRCSELTEDRAAVVLMLLSNDLASQSRHIQGKIW